MPLSLPQLSSAWAWRGRAQAGGGWAWGNGTRETDPNSFLANSAMVNLLGLLEEALHENVFSQILIYKGQNDMAIWGRGESKISKSQLTSLMDVRRCER